MAQWRQGLARPYHPGLCVPSEDHLVLGDLGASSSGLATCIVAEGTPTESWLCCGLSDPVFHMYLLDLRHWKSQPQSSLTPGGGRMVINFTQHVNCIKK
jgi:hypothetical protein